MSIGSDQGSGVLDLLDCLRHQIVHGAANLMIRLGDSSFVEILADLAENVVVAGFLDIGEDDLAGIGFGVGPGLAELFGGPQAERLVAARRNKALGLWAAEKLGKAGADAEAYASQVVLADIEEAGDHDVFRKIRKDFDEAGVAQSDHQIRRTMDDLMAQAIEQIKNT